MPVRTVAEESPAANITVVGIGASAGGLEAICQFLEAMPPDSGLAFVVIQHLDPTGTSLLPELTARHTAMTVRPAVDGALLAPNQVHVITPGACLSIDGKRLAAVAVQPGAGLRMPIDQFLRSLAAARGRQGIGIVLSGTGTDGAQGLKALNEAGGLTLVQDPSEAAYGGMPRHAIAVAAPDHVLPVLDMPEAMLHYVARHHTKATPEPLTELELDRLDDDRLQEIVEVLRSGTGQSFDRYKPGTLRRRTQRRMALHGLGSWGQYIDLLRHDPAEAVALSKDLLIHVTEFFRDPDAFACLSEQLLPALLARHADGEPVRVWVPGCSTGEEAYSIGMVLIEQIAAAGRNLVPQIFATDIDDAALKTARAGLYPETIQSSVSPERLDRFFTPVDGHYKVVNGLREAVLFSRQDLLNDPPFSRLAMISCRNLFIYLKPDAQQRALGAFHFALMDSGLLFLGAAESAAGAQDMFAPVDSQQRIYRRLGYARPFIGPIQALRRGVRPRLALRDGPPEVRPRSLIDVVERWMLDLYAPAAVVTDRDLIARYYFGPIDRYLRLVPGEPGQDLLSMAREGLRPRLRETVDRAVRAGERVSVHGVRFIRDGKPVLVTIEVRLIDQAPEDLLLVTFADEEAPRARATGESTENLSEVKRLEQELAATQSELDRTVRDLRRANEAIKATTEDAMSLNEEFLSTNEELETSKEELQSLNEELTTVNAELRQSLDQHRQASMDLSNLLNSSGIATIFLDAGLRIKIFNARMTTLFAMIDADIGRPLADLLPKFADPALLADVTAAATGGTPSEREVRSSSGAWYLRTIQPYRTETGHIEGAVVTFADVSRVKQAEFAAAAARAFAETTIDAVREPLVVLNDDHRIVSMNAAFRAAFGSGSAPVVNQSVHDLAHPLFAHPDLTTLLARDPALPQETSRVELETTMPDGTYHVWEAGVRAFRAHPDDPTLLLVALDDVTDRRRIVREQLQLMIDALPGACIAVDVNRRIRFVGSRTEALFGYPAEDLIGQPIDKLVPADVRARHVELHSSYLANPRQRFMGEGREIHGVTRDGQRIPLEIGLSPVPTARGLMVLSVIHDLRGQKQSEQQLRDAKAAADRANLAKSRYLAAASHDLRQPLQTINLLLGALEMRTDDREARTTLAMVGDTVGRMTSLLDTLLDIGQIEAGGVQPHITAVRIAAVLASLGGEFTPLAAAKGLTLRIVPSSLVVRGDPQLLIRMIGNLLSNAVKYTEQGCILLGCRRRGDHVRIEVWDSGVGIPNDSLEAVFDEFHRIDRSDGGQYGLGLGLYIVQRYAQLLGYTVEVRSRVGKGTVFAVVVPLEQDQPRALDAAPAQARSLVVLVEDDPIQLSTLRTLLETSGHEVIAARRMEAALADLHRLGGRIPDAIVADYNLSASVTGLDVIARVREFLGSAVPAIVMSGDRSDATHNQITARGHVLVGKPYRAAALLGAVDDLVRRTRPDRAAAPTERRSLPLREMPKPREEIAVIEDEPAVREAYRLILEAAGYQTTEFGSCEAFLEDPDRRRFRCLLADLALPGMDGLVLQERLNAESMSPPIIFVTGATDLPRAVAAMRAGAADFLRKPVDGETLLNSVALALEASADGIRQNLEREDVDARLAALTGRERQVMERMVTGQATKIIAADLGISQRTAEHHRYNVMRKTGARSLAALIRMVVGSRP